MFCTRSLENATKWLLALSLCGLGAGCDDGSTTGTGATGGGGSTTSMTGGAGGTGGATNAGGTGGTSTGGAGGTGGTAAAPDLDSALVWYADNRDKLDAMIDQYGVNSAGYDPAAPPVAIFDWDNTVIKNDVGDATFFWALLHDKILQPPGKTWALTSPYLTPEALIALDTACSALADPGAALPTSTNTACADEIVNIYYNGQTAGGADAWGGFDHRTMEPAYAWVAQLFAGYSQGQVSGFATEAITENLAAPESTKQTVGTLTGLNAWIRIYEQIANLIDTMQKNGFDVWVVSASPQVVVEPFAAQVNVPADHVIGIRNVVVQGKLTYDLEGCGPIPDGQNDGMGTVTGNSMITYIEGKRCWINKVIYGDAGPTAVDQQMDLAKRPVFAAGDSNTDITFAQDATGMKLVINRNKTELMCNAYANFEGKWLINPMFLQPKAQLVAGYPCSTTGCVDMDGLSVPCLDEAGVLIPDQQDTVF